jgi:hypothetical protein
MDRTARTGHPCPCRPTTPWLRLGPSPTARQSVQQQTGNEPLCKQIHQPHRPPYGLRGCRHIPRARPAPRHPLDPPAPQGSSAPALSSGRADCLLPPVVPLRMCYPLDSSKRCCEPGSPSWRSSPDPSRTAGSARLSAASATTRHPRNSTNYVRGSRNSMVSAQRFGVGSSARLDRTTPATPSKAKYLVASGGSTDSSRRSACAAVKGTARSYSRCYCPAATPSQSSGPGPLSGPRSCLDRSKCRAMDVPTTSEISLRWLLHVKSRRADVADEIGPDKHDHHPRASQSGSWSWRFEDGECDESVDVRVCRARS